MRSAPATARVLCGRCARAVTIAPRAFQSYNDVGVATGSRDRRQSAEPNIRVKSGVKRGAHGSPQRPVARRTTLRLTHRWSRSPGVPSVGRFGGLLVWCLVALASGCTTYPGFYRDRAADAADIFTVAFGYGAGLEERVGPLQLGLLFARDHVGLRGGGFFGGRYASAAELTTPVRSFEIFSAPGEGHRSERKTFMAA